METFPTVENVENDTMLMGLFTFLTDGGKGYSTMISPEKLVVEVFHVPFYLSYLKSS